MFRNFIALTINGKPCKITGQNAFAPLSDFLRYHKRLTGTKVVCAEGDCGACTVMLARAGQKVTFHSINSCIFPTFLADGCHLVTVEGLGSLTEIQSAMMNHFGGQCGFCTPGFVMSLSNLFEHKDRPTEQNVKNYLTGNLCRCTGYQPIIQAAQSVDIKKHQRVKDLHPWKELSSELLSVTIEPVLIETEGQEFYAPRNLTDAVNYRQKHPGSRIFSGSTDIGVQINKGKPAGQYQMSLHLIDELFLIQRTPLKTASEASEERVHVGAKVTLTELQNNIESIEPEFAKFLNIFASVQIKNSATLVGNLANGSPIADTTPFLLAKEAIVHVVGTSGAREIPITQFFKSYKTFHMSQEEIITGISWSVRKPEGPQRRVVGIYKVSQRRDLDISCVNACFDFLIEKNLIECARIAMGGVGPVPIRLSKIESQLKGKKIDQKLMKGVLQDLSREISPQSDIRGSADFRILIGQQLFQKFIDEKLLNQRSFS